MSRLAPVLLLLAALAPAQQSTRPPDPGRIAENCGKWAKAFLAGMVDLTSLEDLADAGWSRRAGIREEDHRLTPQRDLELLTLAAARCGTAETAHALLWVAAAAQLGPRSGDDHGAVAARAIADAALAGLRDPRAIAVLFDAARGDRLDALEPPPLRPAAQAAAVRALGACGLPVFRPAIERALSAEAPSVRCAAAGAVARAAHAAALPALAEMLANESDQGVLAAALDAARLLHARRTTRDELLAEQLGAAAVGALAHQDETVDLAAIDLLDVVRIAAGVPALIEVLESQRAKPPRRSPWVLAKAHRTLCSLTGAFFPLAEPQRWREFWTAEQARFVVAPRPPVDQGGTSAARFFDLPATGSRIVFVVDVSGSMGFSDRGKETGDARAPPPTRLDIAKRELLGCVDGLPETTLFNLVLFSEGVREWRSELVPATAENKRRFRSYVERLGADSGTDVWIGLERALRSRVPVRGSRYELPVDEIFVLSDGLPTVGEVQDAHTLLRLATELNRLAGARIHTVYIGSVETYADQQAAINAGMSGAALMQALAERNGGRAVTR